MEYKAAGEQNPFTHSARNTTNVFAEVVNTEMRAEEMMPKIKIENNLVVEVNSDAPLENNEVEE